MELLTQIEQDSSKTNQKVKDVLVKVLEGEVVELAVVMKNSLEKNASFSRSTGSYHSRSGNQFSRASVRSGEESRAFHTEKENKEIEQAYASFLEQLENSNLK